MLRLLVFAGFLLAAAAPVPAQQGPGRVEAATAWARATPGPIGAVYLELRNGAAVPDRLLGASSPLAERIEFHEHRMSEGVMSMIEIPQIELAAGETVSLSPGQRHLMLFGLKAPLKPGERFALTLDFERAGPVQVEVKVGGAGALTPP